MTNVARSDTTMYTSGRVGADVLPEFLEFGKELDARKTDYVQPVSNMRFENKQLIISDSGAVADLGEELAVFGQAFEGRFNVTENAFGQMCGRFGTYHYGVGSNRALPATYLEAFPAELFDQIMNHHLDSAMNRKSKNPMSYLVRTFDDSARAFLSETYPQVSNTKLIDILMTALDGMGVNLSDAVLMRPHLSPDSLHMQIIFQSFKKDADGQGGQSIPGYDPDSDYGLGVAIRHDEVGNGRLIAHPTVITWICTNGMIASRRIKADDEQPLGLSLTHNPARSAQSMTLQFAEMLAEAFKLSGGMVDKMIEAEGIQLPNMGAIISGMAKEHGWSEATKEAVSIGTRGRYSLMGLVDGITEAAHVATATPEDRFQMESMGWDYLNTSPARLEAIARRHAPISAN